MRKTRCLRWYARIRVWAGIVLVISVALAEMWALGRFARSPRYCTQTAEPVFVGEPGMAGLFAAR